MKFCVGWLKCCSRQSREHFLDPVCGCSIPESGVYQRWETVPRPGGPLPWEGIPQRGEAGPSMSRAAINVKITRVTPNVWLWLLCSSTYVWSLTCSVSYVTSIAVVCLRCILATLFHSLFICALNFLAPSSCLRSLFYFSIFFICSHFPIYSRARARV